MNGLKNIEKNASIWGGLKGLGKQITRTSKSNAKKGLGMIDGARNQFKTIKGYGVNAARNNPGKTLAAGAGLGYIGNNMIDQRETDQRKT